MRIVLLGAPGSGKGTQAKLLVSKFRIPQISTGDLLRESLASGSELGSRARAAMDAGHLVSDEIVLEIIRERLKKPDARRGFVLDGFPRNLNQAQALDTMLDDNDWPLDVVVLMEVDNDQLMQRLAGRRTCVKCHRVYNVFSSPPQIEGRCDHCGHRLQHRADDNEETIGNRLRVYDSQTRPLITYFDLQDKLVHLDAVGGIAEIFKRLTATIKPFARRRGKGIAKKRPKAPPAEPVVTTAAKKVVKKKTASKPAKKVAPKKKAAAKKAAKKTTRKKTARKKVTAKKVTKKKAVRKKVARKKVTRKPARKKLPTRTRGAKKLARKKVNKKKVSRKKVSRKKVSKKKVSRKTTRKKTTRKSAARRTTSRKTSRKTATKEKIAKKAVRKVTRKKPVRKKMTARKKTAKKKPSSRRRARK